MLQPSFIPAAEREHGGSLAPGKRRAFRPLSTKMPIHVTLKSDFATGARSLLKHREVVEAILNRSANRFHIRIYNFAIAGNHLHVLLRGRRRIQLQNFFRVFAGHVAQEILKIIPLTADEVKSKCEEKQVCLKNQRKFWSLLIYSRVLTWGREYRIVLGYITQNTLEALKFIAYRERTPRTKRRQV